MTAVGVCPYSLWSEGLQETRAFVPSGPGADRERVAVKRERERGVERERGGLREAVYKYRVHGIYY